MVLLIKKAGLGILDKNIALAMFLFYENLKFGEYLMQKLKKCLNKKGIIAEK